MACGSGCCSPPVEAPLVQTIAIAQVPVPGDGEGGLAPNGGTGSVEVERPTELGCSKGCCGETKSPIQTDPVVVNAGHNEVPQCHPEVVATGCTKGCCGEATSDLEAKPTAQRPQEGTQGCCSPSGKDDGISGACEFAEGAPESELPESTQKDCRKGCCGTRGETQVTNDAPHDQPLPPKESCAEGCCPTPKPPSNEDASAPSCCEGKLAPCCDESCLDRLALRECENLSAARPGAGDGVSCDRGKHGKSCAEHSLKARRTYAERLQALGCICRTLIALGQESCCPPQRRSAKGAQLLQKQSPRNSRSSIDSCCIEKGQCSSLKPPSVKESCGGGSCCAPKFSKSTKEKRLKQKRGPPGVDQDCGEPEVSVATGSCADSCCGDEQPTNIADVPPSARDRNTDLEKGSSGERVVLTISGMTCTGCETKLLRCLGGHPSVKNIKASLVLARAEFDLVGSTTADEIIKHLERTTEFKCEIVTSQGSNLDILVDADAVINQPWPDGVLTIRKINEKTVNVSFDANITGARELVERGWKDGPVLLAPPRLDPTLEAGNKHVRNIGFMTLLSACLTVPVLVMAWAPVPERPLEYGSASLALATLVQVVVAGPFYPKALKALVFSRVVEMDLLVVLSTSAAYIFSVVSFGYMVSGRSLSTGEFFETSTLLVTLIMVGRWLSALARQKAVESISIRSLQTTTAVLVDGGEEREIDARLLQFGDVFKVAPESRVPTDGFVVSGSSEVDESTITGESMPVEKHSGSPVVAGSVNGSGTLTVRLTRLPGDNTISAIAEMVDQAKLSKPKIQDIADRVASYFVPVVIFLTVLTFCVWIAVGIRVRGQPGNEATIQAITYAITVLIVSCPCAIGLAVPMVIVIATGVAAEKGVIFKSAAGIETAHRTAHVVFDKTGTLTEGKLIVARQWYVEGDQTATKSRLLGLVKGIKHPVSVAVAAHLEESGVSPAVILSQTTVAGKGIEGIAKESQKMLRAGNCHWLKLAANPVVESALSQGYTTFCFMEGDNLAAVISLEDSVRPDAASTVDALLSSGISVHLLSGDDDGAVCSVANRLRINSANVRSRCTPADKQAYIRDLLDTTTTRRNGKKVEKPVVMFCGDGTNDAVALAQATIGVHMNEGGTDVAKSAADVVLMRPCLGGILTAMAVSKKSMHRIIFNFSWSFVYNLFAILLAAGAFVNARIPPEYAGLGELVSVLPVIAAAALLRWSKV